MPVERAHIAPLRRPRVAHKGAQPLAARRTCRGAPAFAPLAAAMAVVVRLRSTSGVALLVILALLWQQFGRRRPPSECASPLLLYTAHKTGTILAKHLAAAVNEQLKLPCHAVLQVDYNCPPEIGAPAPALLRRRRRRLDDEGTAPCVLRPRGCVALIARDPRELVVSGFLYHRNGAPDNKYDQSWLNASMWSDAEAAASIRPPTVLPWPHVRFATLLAAAARPGGALHGVLPPPSSRHESYAGYLRRVPERLGLLAEASSALRLSIPATERVMAEVRRRRAAGDCAASACLAELQGALPACQAALGRLLAPVAAPRRAAPLAAAAARAACPASSAGGRSARRHGGGASRRERARLLRLVGEVDATLLNGSLAASARRLSCTTADETLAPAEAAKAAKAAAEPAAKTAAAALPPPSRLRRSGRRARPSARWSSTWASRSAARPRSTR